RSDLRQRPVGNKDVACRLVQAGAATAQARLGTEVFGEFLAHQVRLGLTVAPLHIGNNALEGMAALLFAFLSPRIGEFNRLLAATVQQQLANRLGQRFERYFGVKVKVASQAADHLEVITVAPVPAPDRAAGYTQGRVTNDAL